MNNDTVILQLDRPRILKFTNSSLEILEELSGRSITDIDENMDLMDHKLRKCMVYCAILDEAKERNESLTLEDISPLLDKAPSFGYILEAIVRAWKVAFMIPSMEGNQVAAQPQQKEKKSLTGTKAKE